MEPRGLGAVHTAGVKGAPRDPSGARKLIRTDVTAAPTLSPQWRVFCWLKIIIAWIFELHFALTELQKMIKGGKHASLGSRAVLACDALVDRVIELTVDVLLGDVEEASHRV